MGEHLNRWMMGSEARLTLCPQLRGEFLTNYCGTAETMYSKTTVFYFILAKVGIINKRPQGTL